MSQGGRTRSRQATSHAQNNWMISKIFHVSPLVTVQKIDQRARWGAGDKKILLRVYFKMR